MDWTSLLKDLATAGLSQTRIAELCGSSQTTISDLSRGHVKNPSYRIGAALMVLHEKVKAGDAPELIGQEGAAAVPEAAQARA